MRQVKRAEAFKFGFVRRRRHPRPDLHYHEAMRAGILIFPEAALHAPAVAAQFALHNSNIKSTIVTTHAFTLAAQLAEFVPQYRRRQEDRAPTITPPRDPAQSVLVLAAD